MAEARDVAEDAANAIEPSSEAGSITPPLLIMQQRGDDFPACSIDGC